MSTTAPWYESATFWIDVSVPVASLLAAIVTGWITYIVTVPRQRLRYGLLDTKAEPVTETTHATYWQIAKTLPDPGLLVIILAGRGRRDIPSSSYDQGKPIAVSPGFDIKAMRCLDSKLNPNIRPPRVAVEGSTLEIGPDLIGRRQVLKYEVLVDRASAVADGSGLGLTFQGSLVDVTIKRQNGDPDIELKPWQRWLTAASAAVGIALLVIIGWRYGISTIILTINTSAVLVAFSRIFITFFSTRLSLRRQAHAKPTSEIPTDSGGSSGAQE